VAELADGMLDAFGTETAEHSREVELIALDIADHVGLSAKEREIVALGARLHDIGKIAMPRTVLEKTEALTAEEWKLMFSHTLIGERILLAVDELRDVAGIVRHSHERWDGGGYPDGIQGEQIPLASRIVFCADAFHAICSDRPYRRGRSRAAALAEMRRCAGTQFEPRVVAALTRVIGGPCSGEGRMRRRPGQLVPLLIAALTLGGSVAAGIAAPISSTAPTSGQASAASAAEFPAPWLRTDLELGTDLGARGSVAGAVAHSKRAKPRHDQSKAGSAPALQPSAEPAPTSPPASRLQSGSGGGGGTGRVDATLRSTVDSVVGQSPSGQDDSGSVTSRASGQIATVTGG
jgi:putative nucleotidyltransferase with HDIG domain